MEPNRDLVFVYGTLRRGGSNHFRMATAEFVTAGRIIGFMYRIDWYPGLVLDPAGDDISGEVYAVDADLLGALDAFENVSAADVDDAEYQRVSTLVTLPDGSTLSAWVWEWLGQTDESARIKGGNWLDASPCGENPG